jgi:hypothetical protein
MNQSSTFDYYILGSIGPEIMSELLLSAPIVSDSPMAVWFWLGQARKPHWIRIAPSGWNDEIRDTDYEVALLDSRKVVHSKISTGGHRLEATMRLVAMAASRIGWLRRSFTYRVCTAVQLGDLWDAYGPSLPKSS